MSKPAGQLSALALAPGVVAALEAVLPRMAERTVAAVIAEVPSYTTTFSGQTGRNVERAVQSALQAFLRLATRAEDSDPAPPLSAAIDGAYDLGRGEARNGHTIDALLSAYRVGARVAWRELSETAVNAGLSGATIARFAELVFAFIDELSASSVSGHADELATVGRARQRYLDLLTAQLLAGEPAEVLLASAEAANWAVPATLTAVLLPAVQSRGIATQLSAEVLQATDALPGLDPSESWAVMLVPDMDGARRPLLLSTFAGRAAVLGPARPWLSARSSYRRAVRGRHLGTGAEVLDTDDHLVEIVLGADPEAAEDLRRRALAPLSELRPATADRLAETLRSWLLNRGHRAAVAADLFVHTQTVRYRMTQLRELYGDRLDDPQTILELTVALGLTPSRSLPITSGQD
ncbi:PucR family transcriptional regulator [Nocardia sp. 004]|uniref:PucR family transcriptional regulator n=1 Tax=Nocardia sp. 004 TaxID=3385978 RepID=UPI0039A2818E